MKSFTVLNHLYDAGAQLQEELKPLRLRIVPEHQALLADVLPRYRAWRDACRAALLTDLVPEFDRILVGGREVEELLTQAHAALIEGVDAPVLHTRIMGGVWEQGAPHTFVGWQREVVGLARRRVFPVTGAVPEAVQGAIARAFKGKATGTVDRIFCDRGAEPQWHITPLMTWPLPTERWVYGYLDGLQVFVPQREAVIVAAVAQHLLTNPATSVADAEVLTTFVQAVATNTQRAPAGSVVLAPAVVAGAGYAIEQLITQMNGCYTQGWYDAAAVLIRKVTESLIIELYERAGRGAAIQDKHQNYFMLGLLIQTLLGDSAWSLGRETKQTLPKLQAAWEPLGAHAALRGHAPGYRRDQHGLPRARG